MSPYNTKSHTDVPEYKNLNILRVLFFMLLLSICLENIAFPVIANPTVPRPPLSQVSQKFEPFTVAFTSFQVKNNEQKALVTWTTSSETACDHFDIERSLDTKTWDVIGKTPARGTSTEMVNYSFTDASTQEAEYYYRIKAVGKDGSFIYSRIVVKSFIIPPAVFTNFSGKQENGKVKLQWTTSSEYKNDGFFLESAIGAFWDFIGTVTATDSQSGASYTFIDENAKIGSNIYRLSAVRGSSHFPYEKIIQVIIKPAFVLDTLSGKQEANSILLTWTTSSEINTDRFEIEHSIEGKNWTMVGNVGAKGMETVSTNYVFTHPLPTPGENYYRLKMIDLDHNLTYSKSVKIDFTVVTSLVSEPKSSYGIYPNPSKGKVHFQATGNNPIIKISIANALGQTVLVNHKKFQNEIDIQELTTGLYVISAELKNGQVIHHKIIKHE